MLSSGILQPTYNPLTEYHLKGILLLSARNG
jgi:hypothetical protein